MSNRASVEEAIMDLEQWVTILKAIVRMNNPDLPTLKETSGKLRVAADDLDTQCSSWADD